MLRPQDTATRERKSLNGLWRFALDADGVGRTEAWWNGPLANAREAAVPASYNDLFADPAARDHIGDAWYQTSVRIPAGWQGRRIVLRFDSATHRAVVWVNDTQVAEHEGGYTPFEADVTALAAPGQGIRVTAVVNNELSWQSIPPGFVTETPTGKYLQYYHDFFNYAGLHRSVWLYSTPVAHLSDITVVTGLDGSRGTVEYRSEAEGGGGHEVRAVLRGADGAEVAHATGASGVLTVADVHPWRPGEGYLYDLELSLAGGEEVFDSYTVAVGIRTVEVRGTEFLINGEPFYFTGFGRHEDIPVLGKGHDDAFLVHDFALMDWIGANSFRTSHYPYAEEVMEFADRHGIVVIDETAAVGLNLAVAAGLTGAPPRPTFSPETFGDATREAHAQAIRELIARDKNHPSVVMWCIANEPSSHEDGAREYFEPLVELTRKLDPTRPVSYAAVIFATHENDRLADLFDVLCINRYYGWYIATGDLATAETYLEHDLRGWAEKFGKPIMMSEYGADTMPGLHSVWDTPWTEEYQQAYLEMHHRVFDRIEAFIGEHVWNFADFQTSHGIHRVDGNKKGVFTRDRRPKAAAHALRKRWTGLGGRKPTI